VNRPVLILAAVASIAVANRASSQSNAEWTQPFPPFRIAGNLYYVGSKGLASYLITTPQGHILINSDLEANVPLLQASITQLGFKFGDVKILLISHAHWDHDAGSARVKSLTGASYMVMDGDVRVVESGGRDDFQYGDDPAMRYAPVRVDRVLHPCRVRLRGRKERVDFFLKRNSNELLLNELNTMPGLTEVSGYPKMWAASGLSYTRMLDVLVELALERHREKALNKTER